MAEEGAKLFGMWARPLLPEGELAFKLKRGGARVRERGPALQQEQGAPALQPRHREDARPRAPQQGHGGIAGHHRVRRRNAEGWVPHHAQGRLMCGQKPGSGPCSPKTRQVTAPLLPNRSLLFYCSLDLSIYQRDQIHLPEPCHFLCRSCLCSTRCAPEMGEVQQKATREIQASFKTREEALKSRGHCCRMVPWMMMRMIEEVARVSKANADACRFSVPGSSQWTQRGKLSPFRPISCTLPVCKHWL
ncbi:hypothetical protein MUK42_35503 [Musa troglodytarum]|uniref:Uncharacterized protein n=1 Tax=Musa troglodytarum TaxID=320322 RepID=A0A9E7KE41_9LILI|nr:hypothetical protein MUK42_35503 [Musa troglodytarum]